MDANYPRRIGTKLGANIGSTTFSCIIVWNPHGYYTEETVDEIENEKQKLF